MYLSASNGFFCDRDVAHGAQYVVTQIKSPPKQAGFISSRAQTVKELAEDIAIELEGLDGGIQMTK